MTANDRLRSRGTRRAQRILLELGREVLDARLRTGLSQDTLGAIANMSGDKVGRVERARLATLSILDAAELAAIVGLDLSIRVYPNGAAVRDAGQARRLSRLLSHVGAPLRYRTDVALPHRPGEPTDLRGWDSVLYGHDQRTAIELESRVIDIQAMTRRHALKRRDDPVDHFLLVIANTAHNQRVMREFSDLLPDLPRLRTATVLQELRAGRHPPTGMILF